MIRNNNGQSPLNPQGGARRSDSEGTKSVSTGHSSNSRSSSDVSMRSSSQHSSGAQSDDAKTSGTKKEAAKLLAQGVTNGLVGAFTRGGAGLLRNFAGDAKYGKAGNKLFDDTRTGRRLDTLEERGAAKLNVGTAQLKAGLSAVFGKKVTARQMQRIAEARDDAAQAKRHQAGLKATLQDERAQKRADGMTRAGEPATSGAGARRLQKYEEYGS